MFLKMMGALPGYIYARDQAGIYVNLFVGSTARVTIGQSEVGLRLRTRYPWEGAVELSVEPERPTAFDVFVRVPGWCSRFGIKVDGVAVPSPEIVRGYARLHRTWRRGDRVELMLEMPVERVKAHPLVADDVGRVALMRGPLVYCLESVDNGGRVRNLAIPRGAKLSAEWRPELLNGVVVIRGSAVAAGLEEWTDRLYLPIGSGSTPKLVSFTAIPYYANANRGPVEMLVWAPEEIGR
jgi:DUF1680 family protein